MMAAIDRARSLVLVVDDQAPSRFAKTQILRRAQFDVCEAATGHEALQVAHDRDPDLVLLDVHLPDINGIEVCRRLKAGSGPVPLPVLQISATATTDTDRVAGLQNGADAYLTEPVGADVLVATVHALERVRQLERALSDANRSKDEFLAILSHELRTPLNTMVGRIAQLRREDLAPEDRTRALDALDRSARHQWRLVDELLDVARIEKGKLELRLDTVDVADLVRACADAMAPRLAAAGVELQCQLEPAVVQADASRVQQVVTNLLSNALQVTPQGGLITVTVERTSEAVRISVCDTGVGIDSDLLPHIFDRFRQSSDPLQRGHRGLGLGLAIARGIVEAHRGRITVSSDGPGMGSTFVVSLPRTDASSGR